MARIERTKTMKMNIDELNKWLKEKEEFRFMKIYKKSEYPDSEKSLLAVSLGSPNPNRKKYTIDEAVSILLRIKVQSIKWANDNERVVIDYIE